MSERTTPGIASCCSFWCEGVRNRWQCAEGSLLPCVFPPDRHQAGGDFGQVQSRQLVVVISGAEINGLGVVDLPSALRFRKAFFGYFLWHQRK